VSPGPTSEGEAASWVADLPLLASIAYGLLVVGHCVPLGGYLGD
jgi:hypothetical protein